MYTEVGCVLTVGWSPPSTSCTGSVSQYVLSVTPSTTNCQSFHDCKVVDDSSVYRRPGNETQYSLTVASKDYHNITVRADTCNNTIVGDISSTSRVNLKGS